ncbi:MAG: hypothetical protein ABJK37_13505 [Paraglaciecola sp.]|uniref:hypothetical protein n=1 Tax=Paraglaciecola sp. TaxID=1920173 RepID=UPI003296C67B
MNRSNKGFGLAGVLVTVIFLIVAAIFSASAKSSTVPQISLDSNSHSYTQVQLKDTQ